MTAKSQKGGLILAKNTRLKKRLLVFAGNYRQYIDFLNANNLQQERTYYIRGEEHYLWFKDCYYIMIGTYFDKQLYRSNHFLSYAATHGFEHISGFDNNGEPRT